MKKYSQRLVREVKTRHMRGSNSKDDDKLRSHPSCKPKICDFWPPESRHGGFEFCVAVIEGVPDYFDFTKVYDEHGIEMEVPPAWVAELQEVKNGVEACYNKSGVFWPNRIASWNRFFDEVPWKGIVDIPQDKLPDFRLPLQRTDSVHLSEEEAHAADFLKTTGLDEQGRLRYGYKDGKDVAQYDHAKLRATYGGRLMDGVKYVASDEQIGKFDGDFTAKTCF